MTSAGSLADRVRALLDDAIAALGDGDAVERLRDARRRFDEPLRVAIAGKVKAGKSTLLNALVGEELAPTDAGECTKIVTWYRDGTTYRVTLVPRDGEPVQIPFTRDAGALDVDLGSHTEAEVERLVVDWPSSRLARTTLIDTPGLSSISREVSARASEFLLGDGDQPTSADAVLYLMRHLHADDISFLETFRDDVGHPTPINAIAVLSRADEIAAGRLDAMSSARRVAQRYRADPKIRRLCQTVVPVAGLLAQTGAAFTEDEFRALALIAAAPRADADTLLLTADRFVGAETTILVTPLERETLIDRLGLFGVRLAVKLVREGVTDNASQLATELVARSGITELRELLESSFAARRDALKARSALVTLDDALRTAGGAERERLEGELERVLSGAHELAEIGLLNALRTDAVAFRTDEATAEAERLLGGAGTETLRRLDLPAEAPRDGVRAAAVAAITRWQKVAESPMSDRAVADAARVVIRSCEALIADAG